jgi:uncharacterized protein (TIGR02145 family)
MKFRILLFTMLPILCIAQVSPKEDILSNNNPLNERENLATKHNVIYNLEEIKVRWKKAALENCTGVPCEVAVVTPPVPVSACGSTSTVLDFDGNSYITVAIGTQCWTKTNLKVTKYNDGTLIGDSTYSTWGTATIGARTVFNESGYSDNYGYLYNWYAATDSRKLCPDGWHVPTDSDWNKLVKFIHSGADTSMSLTQSTTAGVKLKSKATRPSNPIGWNPVIPARPVTDDYGFSALPAGWRDQAGFFNDIRDRVFFWSATESGGGPWYRAMEHNLDGFYRNTFWKSGGFSVRCLKD